MATYYKSFRRDLTCQGFQYQEGETYSIDGDPVLYERGFHFCKDLVLTLIYYPIKDSITENKYAEVEVLGDVIWEKPNRHKGCTNKIKIVRVLSDEEALGMVGKKNNSGKNNSGNENAGYYNSGNGNSGDYNSGHGNSGHGNSGHENSGDENSGVGNSGHRNSGHGNSGHGNSGHGNSGNENPGDMNSGRWNPGHGNSGDRNPGNRNSGDWNACDHESGHFNVVDSDTIRVFHKTCLRHVWDNAKKPPFIFFDLDPELGYKGSFQKAYNDLSEQDKEQQTKLLKALPNFDADIFYDISGIRIS